MKKGDLGKRPPGPILLWGKALFSSVAGFLQ